MRPFRLLAAGLILIAAAFFFRFARERATPELDAPAVLREVQRLNQLTTVRYTIQKVIGITEQKQPVGEERILLVMQARVDAGVDLAALRPGDVQVGSNGTVTVRIPAARILNISVDEKETRVWDRQKTWWTPWVPYSRDLESRARQAGIEAIRAQATEMGILNEARRSAESSIRALLGLAGRNAIVVAADAS